jgi:hypothetical protein
MTFADLRREYHREICDQILFVDSNGVPNNADRHNVISVSLAKAIVQEFGFPLRQNSPSGQSSGNLLEKITADYIEKAFSLLNTLRPGSWRFEVGRKIDEFEQYEHLENLSQILKTHRELRATLGDYMITPDIVIGREPVSDQEINSAQNVIAEEDLIAKYTPFRRKNSTKLILHASISCKWTIRSDRSQNVRTEGLNLIRNRKGNTPHIVLVTAEPYPHRIASIALGTGDIDCVYHIALLELERAAASLNNPAITDMLEILVEGKRLRDISDLPFDLSV